MKEPETVNIKSNPQKHSPNVIAYLNRLCNEEDRRFAFHGGESESFKEWQTRARPALRKIIGLTKMQQKLREHKISVDLGLAEDMGDYSRQFGRMETEPDVWIPFWLLIPRGDGPFPLAITPHGHDAYGYNTSVGIPSHDMPVERIQEEDCDVAVQAVRHGFLAIAPATRGLGCDGVQDIHGGHGHRDCRSHLMHCLMVNRTCIGERVYDMECFLDWSFKSFKIYKSNILMVGNSGGGKLTTYASACDERITMAILSCSFSFYQTSEGKINQCDCNTIPGILHFGEFYDVAGLIAPRNLLIVHGRNDPSYNLSDIDQAIKCLEQIYKAAGAKSNFSHRYGEGGHRFYKNLMWPFVKKNLIS